MIQVQDSPEPDPLLTTLEKWVCRQCPGPGGSRPGDLGPRSFTPTPPTQAGDDRAAPEQHAGGGAERVRARQRDPSAADPAGAPEATVRAVPGPGLRRCCPLHSCHCGPREESSHSHLTAKETGQVSRPPESRETVGLPSRGPWAPPSWLGAAAHPFPDVLCAAHAHRLLGSSRGPRSVPAAGPSLWS